MDVLSGGGGWVDVLSGGWLGLPPTHMHIQTHAHMHMHVCKHDNFMQMAAPIGRIPGNSL